jgi:hypothetical protein
MPKNPKVRQLQSERHEVKAKSGGGSLRYEVWGYVKNGVTVVTRYNIAYINHDICHQDNGRVIGYDNAHDYHHRHYMGSIEPVEFVSFASTVELFGAEWAQIVATLKAKGKKS